MVDPIVSPIIATASSAVKQKLDDAKTNQLDDAARVVKYLDAIVAAVKGLECEGHDLLSQAQWMDWSDKKARHEFLARCGTYLDVDNLRTDLSRALDGLDASCVSLVNEAAGPMQLPHKKQRRRAVADDIERTSGEYRGYLHSLTVDPRGLSGIAGAELDVIRHHVQKVETVEQAAYEKAQVQPMIQEALNSRRFAYQALGALEELSVRVEVTFR
jgi:hypothetical protein